MDFARNLRDARNERGMKQDTLARYLNITQPAISQMERGKTKPTIDTVNKVAEALGIAPEVLLHEGIKLEQTFHDQSNNQSKNGIFVEREHTTRHLEEAIAALKETVETLKQLLHSKDTAIMRLEDRVKFFEESYS